MAAEAELVTPTQAVPAAAAGPERINGYPLAFNQVGVMLSSLGAKPNNFPGEFMAHHQGRFTQGI